MAGAQTATGADSAGAAGGRAASEAVFVNRDLFSSYYLGTLLAREVRAHQGETGTRMPPRTRDRLRRLWDDVSVRFGSATGYARTRQAWLEPLLTALGYEPLEEARAADFDAESLPGGYYVYRPAAHPSPQPPPPPGEGESDMRIGDATALPAAESGDPPTDGVGASGGRPDADEAEAPDAADAVPAADSLPLADGAPGERFVLLALLGWGEDFDQPFGSLRRRSETPHRLMERLLAAGPARWGLLLNGQKLRLLKRTVVAGRQQYLEVDAEALFESGDDRDYDTFWTLFRAQAFQPDAQGRCLLDVVDEGSRKHAEGVSATLKTSVFRAMERLMSALVDRAQELARTPVAAEGAVEDAAALRRQRAAAALASPRTLYEQSLVLLYRLLFVLYAESRDLLPVDNPIYRDSYSLEPLRDEVERPDARYLPDGHRLWATLGALFRLIHRGCRTSELVVPAYNGQLFHPASTALLNALRVSDDALAGVLRELSLTPATKDRGRERISYRDLGVEELGAVYEGLLEYEPRIAAEPMVEVRYKDQLAVIPEREQRDYPVLRTFAPGAFYLGHGAGRKTTGSYYTPQPLVDFLVERTLGPLVADKTAGEIMELKLVDPAMGSGAFLVGACLYLAEAYARARRREEPADALSASVEASGGRPDGDDADPAGTSAGRPDGDDTGDLSDDATRPYRRLVAERCIYGVDLNPMAVELAKVSLWLTTLAGDKPLTFLDAHLRCGNSLIGAPLHPYTDASGKRQYRVDTIHPEANKRLQRGRAIAATARRAAPDDARQPALFSGEQMRATLEPLVGRRLHIAAMPSDTVRQMHEKELLFSHDVEGDAARMRLKAICDLWVAAWFWRQPPAKAKPGDAEWTPPLDGHLYRQLAEHLAGRTMPLMAVDLEPALAKARQIAEAVRPFHWELEFPEVYYEPDGQRRARPGFDAVVGNPPWDIVKPNSREFFSAYDPAFRELERAAAERRQIALITEPEIAAAWEGYVADLDREVDFFRLSELYPAQSVEVDGKQTGGDANTYKLFLERAHALLRPDGRAAQIVKAGIYKDQGATGLRQLMLSRSSLDFLFALSNERWIFPSVHHAERFALVGFEKAGRTTVANVRFAINPREAIRPVDLPAYLTDESTTLRVPGNLIERLSPDTLSIMEFRAQRDVDIVSRIYGRWPLLGDAVPGAWDVTFTNEFHMTNDRALFNEEGRGWPLYEGKMIHQYTHRWEGPRYWVEPEVGRAELARAEVARVERALDEEAQRQGMLSRGATRERRVSDLLARLGRGPLAAADVRVAPEAPRLAFRDVAASTNERTLLTAILPSHVFAGNTLNFLAPWAFNPAEALERHDEVRLAYRPAREGAVVGYLCGLLNSFVLDYVLRFKVSAHVNMFYAYQLPVPRLAPGDARLAAIAARVARLVCVEPEFDDLRRELLGDVGAPVATDDDERQALKNEIDALVAHLYGLDEDDLRHILYAPYTFPLVKRAIKDGVMEAFGRMGTR